MCQILSSPPHSAKGFEFPHILGDLIFCPTIAVTWHCRCFESNSNLLFRARRNERGNGMGCKDYIPSFTDTNIKFPVTVVISFGCMGSA